MGDVHVGDLVFEDIPRPALGGRAFRIPEPNGRILELDQEDDVVPPGNLANSLLANSVFGMEMLGRGVPDTQKRCLLERAPAPRPPTPRGR